MKMGWIKLTLAGKQIFLTEKLFDRQPSVALNNSISICH